MNEKSINEQYTYICSLLESQRLKEALVQLESLLWQCPGWELRTRLEQLQTSYKYMLDYMRQGASDPERWKLYRKMITDTWEIADQARIILSDKDSSQYYHEVRRSPKPAAMAHCGLKQLTQQLESFNDDLSIAQLFSHEKVEEVVRQHEETLKYLFLHTWTNSAWSIQEEEEAQEMLRSEQLPIEDACLFVSAVMLSLMACFDVKKMKWLLAVYDHPNASLQQRGLVSFLFLCHIYKSRITFYPELIARIKILQEEHPSFSENVVCIYRQLLLCQETEKIDKKMREEILPEMMKTVSMRNMRFGVEENEEDNDDKNPDWDSMKDFSKVESKLREMGELQQEGADVYMSTFSMLKHFPFFREIQNWFYPFSRQRSEVIHLSKNMKGKENSLLNMLLLSGFLSNSDKYSLYFIVSQLSESQQELMLSQFTDQQLSELAEEEHLAKMTQHSQRAETASNQYLHDLYRFFKLYARRHEFRDLFNEKFVLHHIPALHDILCQKQSLSSIADFYLAKRRWDEAIELFEELETMDGFPANGAEHYQKYGYALQKKKQYAAAIQAYLKADTLKPDNLWNNQHLAACYRQNKEYEKALACYKKVEEVLPEDVNVIFNIGNCLVETEQHEKALNYFFKLDFIEHNSTKAWRGIGWCSFVCKKYEQATKYYEKVIEHKPLAIDYMNAGHVAWAMNNLPKAVELYGKSILLCGSRTQFIEMFHKDEELLLLQGIHKEDIPLMLDLL